MLSCWVCQTSVALTDFFCPTCGMFIMVRSSSRTLRTTASFGNTDCKPWRQRNTRSLPPIPPPLHSRSPAPKHQAPRAMVAASVAPQLHNAAALEQKVMKRVVAKIKEKADSNLFTLISTQDVRYRMYPLSVHEATWLPVTQSSIHMSLIGKTCSAGFSEKLLRVALHHERAAVTKECYRDMRLLMKSDCLQTIVLLTSLQVRILAGVDLEKVWADDVSAVLLTTRR